MARRQRIAIIGCGFFAPNHIHAWKSLPEAELVAVCDRDPERARTAAQLANTPDFTDAKIMLHDMQPDVADIVTTAPSHLELARLCAESGIAVIIQKPLAASLKEALETVDLAERANIRMMVHENFRFQKPIREVKSLVASGAIGEPRYASVRFRCGHDVFTGQPYLRQDERLVLADIGVHIFDVARFLMGEITDLSCRVQRLRPDVRGEDMASALVSFSSGAMGLIEASWSTFLTDDPFPETLISVEGTQGSVVLDRHYAIKVRSGTETREYSAEPACPAWGERPWHVVQDSVIETCRHWLETVPLGLSPATSVVDNVRTLAAVEACYASAAANGVIVNVDAMLEKARVFAAVENPPQGGP
jgi:predicted dehydrogenase